ncbi:hypothetical protein BD309DRAFT_456808 [Dichomitus squalens]|uniref:Uncharacterized protein n=1 Tax=Dichomitus squalens TaxID=114155 RepID=A0A4Q9P374_9APHY|nr:hypothetical protein BD309DRAFT_456808 [Dichomitus squalens]TBU57775.1 hypothetical protein BD310DRAFT_534341 [Dichomitus squalens]
MQYSRHVGKNTGRVSVRHSRLGASCSEDRQRRGKQETVLPPWDNVKNVAIGSIGECLWVADFMAVKTAARSCGDEGGVGDVMWRLIGDDAKSAVAAAGCRDCRGEGQSIGSGLWRLHGEECQSHRRGHLRSHFAMLETGCTVELGCWT